MNFGKKLKELREGKDLSKKELSDLSGLSVVQISNLEQGKNKPSPFTVLKLSTALNCDYNTLYDESIGEEND